MIKRAPTLPQLILMGAFVLSCFGVLLYLWLAFGGTSPLQPKGYRFHVNFPEATQLSEQAGVRISGVPVGTVVKIEPGPGNTTEATIEMESKHAPVPLDARAILRTKSLLGETYVELTPGDEANGELEENGTLPNSSVADTVELDEIFRTFDADTRAAFQTWMQSQAEASLGRGPDINAVFGNLPELVEGADDLLRELNAQTEAVKGAVRDTGAVFDALSEGDGQLRALIVESNDLFQVTAQRNRDLAAIWEELPRFARESRITLPQLTQLAERGTPGVKQLQAAATQMTPAFQALDRLSPEFEGFFTELGSVITATERGVPALEQVLGELPPLLEDFEPFLDNLDPIASYLNMNRREVTGFLANVTAATLARDVNLGPGVPPSNYLRVSAPLGPESITYYPRPIGTGRANAYARPGFFDSLATGLPVLDPRQCANGEPAPPPAPPVTDINAPASLEQLTQTWVFRTPGRDVAAPPCVGQGLYPGFGTVYPQLKAIP